MRTMVADNISFDKEPKKGLVSIIIPTRNGRRFIGESLASISDQSYTNWEVIVVEDGSNDGTSQVVKEFSRKHRWHRVEYIRNERRCGVSHTRNIAFRMARGEFVALLDVDDRWLPEHLSVSVQSLAKSKRDVAYSTSIMIEDLTNLPLGVWGPTNYEIATFPNSLFGRSFITPSATIMRRQVLADVGPWDTSLDYCEDLAFWFRCVRAGKKFEFVPGVHCLYRKNHEGAATNRMCQTLENLAKVTEEYMTMPGLKHDTTRRFVAKSYALAARYHRKSNLNHDPSADRSRCGPLLIHAWRLRPKHVSWLVEGWYRNAKSFFRRKKQAEPVIHTLAAPACRPQLKAAA